MRCFLLLASLGLASGCGFFLDLDPTDDAGGQSMDAGRVDAAGIDAAGIDAAGIDAAGIDAARPDAGPPAECATDLDCDDGSFCNGAERCDLGHCAPGAPIDCDDGVGCTIDRCDDASASCEHGPDDGLCADSTIPCLNARCQETLGCVVTLDDAACDDSVACTIDQCTRTGCEHTARDGACEADEYCEPASGAGFPPGCRPIPVCVVHSDCPRLQCNSPGTCESGVCRYTPISLDPACADPDPCVPTYCSSGVCVSGTRRECAVPDLAACTVEQCLPNEAGDTVTCVPMPRTGPCTPSAPCSSGACSSEGTCLATTLCPAPSSACRLSICTGGGCGETNVDCGVNATCVNSGGGASCSCHPGFVECGPGAFGCGCRPDAGFDAGPPSGFDAGARDAGFDAGARDAGVARDASLGGTDGGLACAIGSMDCDGDGSCECHSLVSRCLGLSCECLASCPAGQMCCREMSTGIGYCGGMGDCRWLL